MEHCSGTVIRSILKDDIRRAGHIVIELAIRSLKSQYTDRYLQQPTRGEYVRGLLRDAVDELAEREGMDDED